MNNFVPDTLKTLLQRFINYHFSLREAETDSSAYRIYDNHLNELAEQLNHRITQSAKPDEWVHVGHLIFNAALVELVIGDAECCSIFYQHFSREFEGEDAAAVWAWFSAKATTTSIN